jgi:hypothetical protein
MPVPLFEREPARCPYGHPWGPRLTVAGYLPCGCDEALAGAGSRGHLWILCLACEDDGRKTFYYEPSHFGDEDKVPGAVMRRDGPGGWVSVPVTALLDRSAAERERALRKAQQVQ